MVTKFKVIPQKLNLQMICLETFPECSQPSIVSKNTIKMIGHHSRLKWLPRVFTNTLAIEHELEKETWLIYLRVFPVEIYQYGTVEIRLIFGCQFLD